MTRICGAGDAPVVVVDIVDVSHEVYLGRELAGNKLGRNIPNFKLRHNQHHISECKNRGIDSIDPSNLTMPRPSNRAQILDELDKAALALARATYEHIVQDDYSSTDSLSSPSSDPELDDFMNIMAITPPSPLSPFLSDFSDFDSSGDEADHVTARYNRLQHQIAALRDEVEKARILHRPDEPMPRAPQLHLLVHFGEHRPHLFRQKLRVEPEIFDDILDLISDHPIFSNNSHNPQLPVSIQLAIFLNRAGHYGNAIAVEDVAQWAGISIGSVVNCTNCVMVALLDQHDAFMGFPPADSEDFEHAREYVAETVCPEWQNGILAVDGSTINVYQKPGFHGEVFFDRKSRYSLGCQVHFLSVCLLFVIKLNYRPSLCPIICL